MKTGVIQLSDSFFRHLRQRSVAKRIAPLQLAGRIEDYLVKEFMQFVFHQSDGRRFCETNFGLKGEARVDVAICRSGSKGREVLEALIEAKYLSDRGHRSGKPHGKFDEIRPTLSSLRRQLRYKPGSTQRRAIVGLRGRSIRVYGLVFAGYAKRENEEDTSRAYIQRILQVADEFDLRFHDLPRPYFRKAFQKLPISVLGEKWLVSLWGGLWCIKRKS